MIRTLAIANYRSIRDLTMELHGLDVVTGANGSGKSSLYRALRLLETGRPRPTAFSRDPEIKREQIFSGPVARPGSLLVDRKGGLARLRGPDGEWTELSRRLDTFQSMLRKAGSVLS